MSDSALPPPESTSTSARYLSLALNVLILLALLYVFLFSIALFGAAFKMVGKGFSEALIATTTNPVIGLMIGLLATSLIQSSSSSTSIVVGMVAGGALTVQGAICLLYTSDAADDRT